MAATGARLNSLIHSPYGRLWRVAGFFNTPCRVLHWRGGGGGRKSGVQSVAAIALETNPKRMCSRSELGGQY